MDKQFVPNTERVSRDLDALANIGKVGATGVSRLAFTPEDIEARKYVMDQMSAAKLDIRVDAIGNIFARRAGKERNLAPVMFGSHIDTPPLGGRYDGTVGVVGALEVIRMLNERNFITKHPLEVVIFAAEEPGRFGLSLLGSRATANHLTMDRLTQLRDKNQMTLWDALEKVGLHPEQLASCRISKGYAKAYVELHIEQGPVLEKIGHPIGVVTAIAAATRSIVTVHGETAHSGAAPMDFRRDALTTAATLILGLESLAREESKYRTVGTVGALEVKPGVLNIVPGEATFTVDVRGIDPTSKTRMFEKFRQLASEVAQDRKTPTEIRVTADDQPILMTSGIVEGISEACREIGIDPYLMPSGGGHDAGEVASYADAGMIFVSSNNGISHAPEEYTDIQAICRGVEVLARSVTRLSA